MGNLRDELLKAKVLSQKDNKRIAHEQRVERTEKGREGVEAEQRRHQEEIRRLMEERKARTREAQARLDEERQVAQRRAQIVDLVRSHAQKPGGGNRRFHFVTRSGAIPFVTVDMDAGRKLEAGQLAIVEDLSVDRETFVFVERAVAQKVQDVDREAVRFLNGR